MTKSALKKISQYKLEKALADAICHEMPISYGDADNIDLALIGDEKCKRIIGTFKELYQRPDGQPNNKQIADEVHSTLIKIGYSKEDANKEADAIENLTGRKRQPSISLVAEALRALRTDTTKPSHLSLVSESGSPLTFNVLLDLCDKSGSEPLDDIQSRIVSTFNSSHSIVQHGAKTLVCARESDHKGNVRYVFSAVPEKRSFFANLNFSYMVEGNQKTANCFNVWLKDHNRKTYQGVVFDPSNQAANHFLNMWQGFAVQRVEGDDKLDAIKWHLRNIICDGNEEHFRYLLAWMAHIVQKPAEKTGVCVALKSDARGTGKSTVSVLLEKLLGQHAIRVQDGKHLLGAFNSHLANKLLVTIEEAFWSGSAKDAGKFRTLITESTITIEAKGKDAIEVDSYHRYLLCTNNDWVVPQTQNERRFFVLEVSEEKAQDKEYFDKLYQSINSDQAMGQFFNLLMEYDITPFNLNKAPLTKALQEQIFESLPSEAKWLQGLLEDGSFIDGNVTYELDNSKVIPKSSFLNNYLTHCEKMDVRGYDRCDDRKLGKYLIKVVGLEDGGRPTINGSRARCYKTKPLEEMTRLFNEHYSYK